MCRFCDARALYLNAFAYAGEVAESSFRSRFEAAGHTLDMGVSCVRFRSLDDLPLDVIAETVASLDVDTYIAQYEAEHEPPD